MIERSKICRYMHIFFIIIKDRVLFLAFVSSCVAVLSSCAHSNLVSLESSDIIALNEQNSNPLFVMGPGDRIAVKFFYNDKLNDEVTVRPDGKISLQLIEDIKVAGLSPAELKNLIIEHYSKIIGAPEVTIEVKESVEQRVYVGGEVKNPGIIPLKGKLRTLDAMIQSGWALNSANLENTIVIRESVTEKPEIYALNIKKVISGELPDIVLKPHDIVLIPKTGIADSVVLMQQIYNMLPNVSFPFIYSINRQVLVTQ